MDSGYYAACAGLVSRMEALDVLANNLANTNTDGYKTQEQFYSALDASLGSASANGSLTPLNQAMNRYGVVGGQWLNLQEGSLVPTGNKLDVAIQGAGFFALQTGAGIRYTRDGSFHLNAKRQLVGAQGELVLGAGQPKAKPIQVPAGDISISSDGTVSVNGAMVGKLEIVNFTPGTQLALAGNGEFTAPAGAAKVEANPSVQQGVLEASNTNAVTGMVSLILAERNAQMMERAMTIFSTDFDKTAASLGQP
jgi:flagellar basal-body rod protein FlgF